MRLVGIITNVSQKKNVDLIGDIVILEEDLVCTPRDYELCYKEYDHGRPFDISNIEYILNLNHSVCNIDIIGVY